MTKIIVEPTSRRAKFVLRVLAILAIAGLVSALAYAGLALTRTGGRVAALWLPNAVLVGILLRTRNNSCPWIVAACFAANVVTNMLVGDVPSVAVTLSFANATEVVIAIFVMRRAFGRNPEVGDLRTLGAFLALAIMAPLASGAVALTGLATNDQDMLTAYGSWVISDGLSLAIVTPLILVAVDAWRARRPLTRSTATNWGVLLCLALIGSVLIFSQERFPFLFLACPIVIVAAFRAGIPGTAASVGIVAVVASIATFLGTGPIMLVHGDVAAKILVLQAFLATAFAMGLPVATVLAGRETLRRQLADAQSFTSTILDNMQEVVFRTDTAGRWIFLNPAWENLTGYSVRESLGWTTTKLLHTEDKAVTLDIYPKIAVGDLEEARLRQRFFTASGERRHIEVLVRRLTDGDGRFIGTTGNIRDVSEAVHHDRELAESEARFRCMAEAAPVGIFRADALGQVTYVNRLWCEKVGLTVNESLGSGWMQAVADPQAYADDPAFTGFHAAGDVRRRTVRLRGVAGDDLWVETVNAAEFDENGTLTGYVGVIVDVTVQRAATEALRDSERKFQTLANLAPAGIFRTDGTGNCQYVNDAWLRLTGFEDDSWRNDGWTTSLHPDDRDRVYAAWAAAVAERRAFREEWRWVRKDGSISWVDGIGRPEVDEKGVVSSFVGVNIDITERRAAEVKLAEREAQLELLATNATDAVFRIGLDGRCRYASPSVGRLTGIDPAQIVGRQMLARFHPEDCATVTDAFLNLASGSLSETIITYRSELAGEPGVYRWLEANCGLVRDVAGRPSEVIASIRDVSSKKEMEEALRQARANAENATSAKAAFLANMSHEIRTPMNGVLGFTELLAASSLDQEQQRQVQLIAESGRAMMRLLNDILDISKIDSGQMEISSEPVDLRHKLQNCVRLMEAVAMSKGLLLTLDIDPVLPEYILSDALRIRQIALNLIGNALKFTDTGGVTVRASVLDQTLLIEVIDTGVGIPDDRLNAIFQQFAQADGSIARRFGGTGLGLSISSELARLMGGAIDVRSELDKGSTFTIRLPLQVTTRNSNEQAAFAAAERNEPLAKRARILIAEDYEINQMLMLSLATAANFDAAIAKDGAEAVRMVEDAAADGKPYDLVFMDMQMPLVDGLEATRRLRARGFSAERLPIVALTANAYQDDIRACLEAGMQTHLSKPVRTRDLTDVISRFVKNTMREKALDQPVLLSADSIQDLYLERRETTLKVIATAVREKHLDKQSLAHITDLLHKLAGTAGFFGEAALGSAAAELEAQLTRVASDETLSVLSDGWPKLADAA
ncbi:PAS domain S-box protein [Sphingomonas glacialis]|uniref:histidine kinase n=1 Tax=Sphingomonas glacialis TaxID=658225 RepID=A0A502FAX4_9SPHN|nr:PAS domain S-box protein [Sphingomonas glacialis]TPG46556.1 PAS domain S-box protein [Sphingomonas glacialis]